MHGEENILSEGGGKTSWEWGHQSIGGSVGQKVSKWGGSLRVIGGWPEKEWAVGELR